MQTLDSIEVFDLVKNCRTCYSSDLEEIVDLGLHPLANSLLDSPNQEELAVPLVLIRCGACTTIQLSVNVNPRVMFQDYLWVTGTTHTAREHCKKLAAQISEKLGKKDFSALEIGSNDGTLLIELIANGAKEVIGVDPAKNLQPKHLSGPIRLVEGFFSNKLMDDHKHVISEVDLVVARNVLSHVPNLNDVMQGIDKVISDDGLIVIEFHEASRILSELHYDSIYHEHTFYHSIRSIQAALSQISFNIYDI
jgi:SAM-dependent methyltransferase